SQGTRRPRARSPRALPPLAPRHPDLRTRRLTMIPSAPATVASKTASGVSTSTARAPAAAPIPSATAADISGHGHERLQLVEGLLADEAAAPELVDGPE